MQCNSDLLTTLSLRGPAATVEEPKIPAHIGDYAITRWLGAGGMGTVYEGCHMALDRWAAIKVLRAKLQTCRLAEQQLVREARALAQIQHPNIVLLFELGRCDDGAFIAMELVTGTTLREWLHTTRATPEILDIFLAIGDALLTVHSHDLVHRDVNPSNVFVSHDGTPKLGDFGLVAPAQQRDEYVVGTAPYMAPEQMVGEPVDARGDQYAFCVSLYEALAGELPDGSPANPLPRPLRSIISQGLAADPDRRFPSMRELLVALASARRSLARRWISPRA
ncbi:MAG TPA: serine/threonine-protein kinase [Kofleriaceae bacterium]|nr:serine/threonine-protein kinase [Kofleriaceae bacterium]